MGPDVLVMDPGGGAARFLEDRLSLDGYSVQSASSLEEAVSVARAGRPWLVVTSGDTADGLFLCHEVKSDPRLSDVVVVVVSSGAPGRALVRHWLDAGTQADLYVRRPLGNAFFGARLERWLSVQADTVGMHSQPDMASVSGTFGADAAGVSFEDVSAELDQRELGLTARELALEQKESALVQRESQVGVELAELRRQADEAEGRASSVRMEVEAQRADLAIARARAQELHALEARLADADSSAQDLRAELEKAGAAARDARAEVAEVRTRFEAAEQRSAEAEEQAAAARAEAQAAHEEAEAAHEEARAAQEEAKAAHEEAEAAQEEAKAAHEEAEQAKEAARTAEEEAARARNEAERAGTEAAQALQELTRSKTDNDVIRAALEEGQALVQSTRSALEESQAEAAQATEQLAEERARRGEAEAAAAASVAELAGLRATLPALLAAVEAHEQTLQGSQASWKDLGGRVGRAVQVLLQTTQKFPETGEGLFPLLHELEAVLTGGGALVQSHADALEVEREAADAVRQELP